MNLKKILILTVGFLCSIALLWRCSSEGREQTRDILYKVGAFEATRYEVDQDLINFKAKHPRINNDRLLESWADEMRIKAYFLADAYAKRYDTLSVIHKRLDFAVKYKIAQEGGYLWKRNVVPKLHVSDSEVADAYKKREDIYYTDVLFFSDERLLRDLNKHKAGNAAPKFYELVKEFRGRAGVQFSSVALSYPFTQLASVKDEICQMKVGSSLGPVSEPEGSYFIMLTRKQKREFLSLETDRQYIEQDLIALKRKLAIGSKQDSIYRTAKLFFHDANIELLSNQLKHMVKNLSDIDTTVLMTYYLNDSEHRFLAKDYQEFRKYTPLLVGDFSQPQQIRDNLKDHLIRVYLYEEARRLGILADETFVLEKQYYYHALLEQQYYVDEFERNINISVQEQVDYYHKNQNAFSADQIVWVSFIEFTNEYAAYQGIPYFQSVIAKGDIPKLSDTTMVQGIVGIRESERVDATNTAWGESNRKQFVDAKMKMLFGPIKHNNRVYLYYISKKETENVNDFSAVRKKVYAQLKLVRMEELKLKRISELKTAFGEQVEGLRKYCEARKHEL